MDGQIRQTDRYIEKDKPSDLAVLCHLVQNSLVLVGEHNVSVKGLEQNNFLNTSYQTFKCLKHIYNRPFITLCPFLKSFLAFWSVTLAAWSPHLQVLWSVEFKRIENLFLKLFLLSSFYKVIVFSFKSTHRSFFCQSTYLTSCQSFYLYIDLQHI